MKTVLNVKVDDKLKTEAQKLAKQLGIPLSTVVNANLVQFVNSRELTISALPQINPAVEADLKAIEADIKAKKNLSSTFGSTSELGDYLDQL